MKVTGRIGIARLASPALSADGTPPTEFRLFVSGWNETENGRFLFDDEAAEATISAYQSWGVDLAIDLEHQMLDPEIAPDPTAKDARGWCNLELRPDGSLWAVNVSWTPDGIARLTEKRQRYVSPAFAYDTDSGRVTSVLNIALTAMPATHSTPALVAASRMRGPKIMANQSAKDALARLTKMQTTGQLALLAASGDLTPKLVSDALAAVAAKDAKGSLAVLQQILAALLGGTTSDDAPPSSAAGGPPDSSAGAPPGDGTAANGAPPPPAKKKDDMTAAASVAMAITGKTNPGEAMAELARRSQIAVDVETREAALAADRHALEAGERRALVGTLVKLGVEIPATAWSDDKGTVPCDRLAAEPLVELRARVKKLSAAGVRPGYVPPTPPAGSGEAGGAQSFHVNGKTIELSASELAICAQSKCKPEDYAALKVQRDAAKPAA